MEALINWINSNKEWLFSGIGILVISGLIFLTKKMLFKRRSRVSIIITNNDQKINNILSRSIAEISSSTGVEVRHIGMHLWIITELPGKEEVLKRVARVRMSDTTPSKTYHWKKGEGVVGQCWEKQTDISLDLTDSQYDIAENEWRDKTTDFRMRMSYKQFVETTKHFRTIFASPIVPEYETVGCVSLNFDKDVEKTFDELWTEDVKKEMRKSAKEIALVLY